MPALRLLALALVVTLAAACSPQSGGTTPSGSTSASATASGGTPVISEPASATGGDLLPGTEWQLIWSATYDEAPANVDLAQISATLVFAEKKATGQAPVNTYRTPYSATPEGDLAFGPIASTRMSGPPVAMSQEQEYFALLERVDGYTATTQGQLTLFDGTERLAIFAPTALAPAAVVALGLIGVPESDAEATVTDAGFTFRVISRDGVGGAITDDFRFDRIDVEIVDGLVTSAAVY